MAGFTSVFVALALAQAGGATPEATPESFPPPTLAPAAEASPGPTPAAAPAATSIPAPAATSIPTPTPTSIPTSTSTSIPTSTSTPTAGSSSSANSAPKPTPAPASASTRPAIRTPASTSAPTSASTPAPGPTSPAPQPAARRRGDAAAERAEAERVARGFLAALAAGRAEGLAAAAAERFSFDGDVVTGREPVRAAWRARLAGRPGPAPQPGAVEVLAGAEALSRHGAPPARLAPLLRAASFVAVGDVGGRTVVLFLAREAGRMAVLGMHD